MARNSQGSGLLDLALDPPQRPPAHIRTLLLAAREHLEHKAVFALVTATAVLGWIAAGHSCGLRGGDY